MLSTSFAYAAEPKKGFKYVGSEKSENRRYHYFSCEWAKKIYQKNAIYFKSAKEAQQNGYTPCKVCRPPTID
ncbi:MAG: Ada metal-binding domain-containing protein [Candidatus Brocadiales bacterium]